MQEAHVHDIMQMMMDSGENYTRATLKKAIIDTFGITTTYCSCSVNGMTPDEAIEFLEARGKFLPATEGNDEFYTDESVRCHH